MNNQGPIFDPTTQYRIELQGRVDLEWLQNFVNLAEMSVGETNLSENITVLSVHTDQAGIVGLVRRLHGLGMAILQLEIISEGKPRR